MSVEYVGEVRVDHSEVMVDCSNFQTPLSKTEDARVLNCISVRQRRAGVIVVAHDIVENRLL